ncbi:MAG: hypothetical protein QF535_00090 [Anaerolineales bacterium]|nr:hypothetical protein [Anaerolineales bacterium]
MIPSGVIPLSIQASLYVSMILVLTFLSGLLFPVMDIKDTMEYRFRLIVLCLIPFDLRVLNQSSTASFIVNRSTKVIGESPSHGNMKSNPDLMSFSTFFISANRSYAVTFDFVLNGMCLSIS